MLKVAALVCVAGMALTGCGNNTEHNSAPARLGAGRPSTHASSATSGAPHPSQGDAQPGPSHSTTAHPDPAATTSPGSSTDKGQSTAHQGSSAISTPALRRYIDLRDSVIATLQKKGPDKALTALDRKVRKDARAQGVCHAVAHELGHATLAKYKGNAAKALAVRNDVCGGGYTHGVVEMALKDSKNVPRDMLRICAPRNDGSCWHGVGHGVMFASRYRPAKAEKLCSRAPSNILVARCAEGIYMQLFTLDDGAAHVATSAFEYPTSRTAAKTCYDSSGIFADACWYYSPTVWLQEKPEDWKGAIRWCDKLKDYAGRGKCTAGVGSRLVKYHPDDIPFAAKQCRKVDADIRGRCLAGMGSYWSVHWHGTKSRASVCEKLRAKDLYWLCRRVNV